MLSPLRRRRAHRHRIIATALVGAIALTVPIFLRPAPMLVWNASASTPLGVYLRTGGLVIRGDFVVANLPEAARRLAAQRGYLPTGVPLVKRVAAVSGQTVCARGDAIRIDGRLVARRLTVDSRLRPLPAWHGCRALRDGEFFLLMPDVPDSFDSRYFGPVGASSIIGRLVPLWTW